MVKIPSNFSYLFTKTRLPFQKVSPRRRGPGRGLQGLYSIVKPRIRRVCTISFFCFHSPTRAPAGPGKIYFSHTHSCRSVDKENKINKHQKHPLLHQEQYQFLLSSKVLIQTASLGQEMVQYGKENMATPLIRGRGYSNPDQGLNLHSLRQESKTLSIRPQGQLYKTCSITVSTWRFETQISTYVSPIIIQYWLNGLVV